jgi:hypothetical protein
LMTQNSAVWSSLGRRGVVSVWCRGVLQPKTTPTRDELYAGSRW